MIKGNQKLLNIFRILIDTAIIIFSFVIAYYLRFDEQHSILISSLDGSMHRLVSTEAWVLIPRCYLC